MAKYAQDFGLASNPCFPYEAGEAVDAMGVVGAADAQPACSKQCPEQHHSAYDYRYLGGYFGNCSEVRDMRPSASAFCWCGE